MATQTTLTLCRTDVAIGGHVLTTRPAFGQRLNQAPHMDLD